MENNMYDTSAQPVLMLFACGSALCGRKTVSRIRGFPDRFGSWQL
jgi:hypothetical protein